MCRVDLCTSPGAEAKVEVVTIAVDGLEAADDFHALPGLDRKQIEVTVAGLRLGTERSRVDRDGAEADVGRGGEVRRRRQFALLGFGLDVSIPTAARGAWRGFGFNFQGGVDGRFGFCRWRRLRLCQGRGSGLNGVNLGDQPPLGGLETGGGQDRLDGLRRTISPDLCGQQAFLMWAERPSAVTG